MELLKSKSIVTTIIRIHWIRKLNHDIQLIKVVLILYTLPISIPTIHHELPGTSRFHEYSNLHLPILKRSDSEKATAQSNPVTATTTKTNQKTTQTQNNNVLRVCVPLHSA